MLPAVSFYETLLIMDHRLLRLLNLPDNDDDDDDEFWFRRAHCSFLTAADPLTDSDDTIDNSIDLCSSVVLRRPLTSSPVHLLSPVSMFI